MPFELSSCQNLYRAKPWEPALATPELQVPTAHHHLLVHLAMHSFTSRDTSITQHASELTVGDAMRHSSAHSAISGTGAHAASLVNICKPGLLGSTLRPLALAYLLTLLDAIEQAACWRGHNRLGDIAPRLNSFDTHTGTTELPAILERQANFGCHHLSQSYTSSQPENRSCAICWSTAAASHIAGPPCTPVTAPAHRQARR